MLLRLWYRQSSVPHPLLWPLVPLSWLYRFAIHRRAKRYESGALETYRAPIPVIVVGNITVGGTGKTPLVIWLTEYLKSLGLKPGVISRGYGGNANDWPRLVSAASKPREVGDEPVLIARRARVPVVCDPDRPRGVRKLLDYGVNIVVSDDGLQHYALQRDLEMVVIDAARGFGNRHCLPAGPLREPVSNLKASHVLVYNGVNTRLTGTSHTSNAEMLLENGKLRNLASQDEQSLSDWRGKVVHAVAGIGNPDRFFNALKRVGIRPITHPFPDHHQYNDKDLRFGDDIPIVMTEKDAVKCLAFQQPNHWYLPVTARLEPASANLLDAKIKGLLRGFKTA